MEVLGVVVCSAGSMNWGLFTCWEVGPGAPEGLSSLPRRVASSSRVGEGPDSSSTSLNREATITSSLSMIINGAMHCWSILTALHRTPGLDPDVSTQTCSALARAKVFPRRWPRCPMGQRQEEESPVDEAHVGQVGHPTRQKPLVAQGAA